MHRRSDQRQTAAVIMCIQYNKSHYRNAISKQESRAVARKSRDAAADLFGLKFADDIYVGLYNLRVAKLRKPGFRAPNIPAQNRI